MTIQSERLKASHRGYAASISRLSALDTFGLRYVRVDNFNVVVEGEYELNLAMSFWRSLDGRRQGYLISALDAEIRKRNSEKPVTGRDSVAEGGRTASTTTDVPSAIAESVTGHTSSRLLPVVSP